jgi:hypothetical protein
MIIRGGHIMQRRTRFEFRRVGDATVYLLTVDGTHNDRPRYKRADKDLWCLSGAPGKPGASSR